MSDERQASEDGDPIDPPRRLEADPDPGPDTRSGPDLHSGPDPLPALGVEQVRKQWARVVAGAAAGARIVIHAPHGVRAVLAPPSPDVIAAQGELPAFTMTDARQGLGNLVRAAAAGTPQLLLRYRTVYAQITHLAATPAPVDTPPAAAQVTPPATITRPDTGDIASERPAAPAAGRRVAGFATALGEAVTARRRAVSFGPTALDQALGGGALP
ncbi:hypothetical protein GT354_21965, partial [Streptomyces sp. SID3343]|nr:hypothetical protein [Streptomyces sp. SID3343]